MEDTKFEPIYISNINNINDDILNNSIIVGDNLIYKDNLGEIRIKLSNLISNSCLNKRDDILELLIKKNINFNCQPKILMMCCQMGMDDICVRLINYGVPIDWDNYRCILYLAYQGKLELLKLIIDKYDIPDKPSLVIQIIIHSIIYGHLHILKYFCPYEYFSSIPDFTFTFLINSIQFGGHLDVIKYFIEGGVSIAQQKYLAVEVVKKYSRTEILHYFVQLDNHILTLLTFEEKIRYCLIDHDIVNKYIGLDEICCIMKDPIEVNQQYFQCVTKNHFYKKEIWVEWIKKSGNWKCPICQNNVEQIIYTNFE